MSPQVRQDIENVQFYKGRTFESPKVPYTF